MLISRIVHLKADKQTTGQIRIIGGKWRSRKIDVVNMSDLRPTPNRVRETLFNWLIPYVDGAVCLDMYAGSGALGFEALSRGAAKVVMLDKDPAVIEALKHNQAVLKAEAAEIIQADAPVWLQQDTMKYDIVFLDPPFQSDLLQDSCKLLVNSGCLRNNTYIYIETESGQSLEPTDFCTIKTAQAGQVQYSLCVYDHERGD